MSKAKLKKTLAALSKEEMAEMVMELYERRKDAREYLDYWVEPDSAKELERRKVMAHKLFMTSSGTPRRLPTATVLKKVVNDFATICFEPDKILDLMASIASDYISWLRIKNKMTAYTAVEKWLTECRNYMESASLESRYELKIENLWKDFEDIKQQQPRKTGRRGWGWHRALMIVTLLTLTVSALFSPVICHASPPQNGSGKIEYDNGDVYKGHFKNGKRSGKGKLTCADGRVFEGEWANDDLRHGKLTYKTMGTYEGYFRDLKLDGYGVRKYPDKRRVEGTWKADNRHGIIKETDKKGKQSTSLYLNGIKTDYKVADKGDRLGIDLSRYQENVIWQELFLHGDQAPDYRLSGDKRKSVRPVEFVIIKATEGGDHADRLFLQHRDNAERHNLRKGFYHFYNTTASATANARNYITNVSLDKRDLPPILDIEKDNVPVDSLRKWLDLVERHYGRKPMIYTNERYYKKYVEGTRLAKYPLWYSRFGQRDVHRGADILQFTDQGRIEGVKNHAVDINLLRKPGLLK